MIEDSIKKENLILSILKYRQERKKLNGNLTSTSHTLNTAEFMLVLDFLQETFSSYSVDYTNNSFLVTIPLETNTFYKVEEFLIKKIEEKRKIESEELAKPLICEWKKADFGSFGISSYEWMTTCGESYDVDKYRYGNFCLNCGGKHP